MVRSLQAAWPETRLTWIIGSAEASLLGDIEGIEFLVYDKQRRRLDGRRPGEALAQRHFDVLLHMQASWRANLLALRIPAALKLGFDRARARDLQWLFTHRRIPARPRSHVMDGLFAFAEALGVHERRLVWDIPVPEADRRFSEDLLPRPGQALLISPCSSERLRNYRNWPADRYVAVARYARQRYGMTVLATGSGAPAEQPYAAALREAGALDLIGRTTLKQLLALIARSRAVLCPDSGPAHMATAVGTPVIGLYASSNPRRTGPLDLRWTVNAYDEAVRACLGRSPDDVPWGRRVRHSEVMDRIPVDAVISRLDALMATAEERRLPLGRQVR